MIPRQFKNHPNVKDARKGGFEFEGKENKSPLDTYSKKTGNGQHANHPKYNNQIKKKLNEIKETKTPKQKAEEVRDVVKQAKKAVRDNPTKKLNDIKIK